MRLSRFTAGLGVLTASAVGLALVPGIAVAAPAHATPRHAVHLRASSHHRITAPEVVAPGLVHLVNDGSRPLAIVATAKNTTPAQLAAALRHPSHKNIKLLESLQSVAELQRQGDAYARLQLGHLFVLDDSAYPFRTSGIDEISVAGRTENAAAPRSVLAVVTRHRTLSIPATARPGEYVHVMNRVNGPALMLLARLPKNASPAKVSQFLAHPSLEDLFDPQATGYLPTTPVAFPAEPAAHSDYYTRLPSAAGTYIIGCLLPARRSFDLSRGQVREITIK